MKVAYFDCFCGAAGDMVLGAIVDAGVPLDAIARELAKLDVKGFHLEAKPARRGFIAGTEVDVVIEERDHATPHDVAYEDIRRLIEKSALHPRIKQDALAVFRTIGVAEAAVHGVDLSEIHFHEVGALDSIADIVGSCAGLHLLGVEAIYSSPIPVNRGYLTCRHGTFPVPPPAVAEMLKGVPVTPVEIEGEIITPTGAAILLTLARRVGPFPPMTVHSVHYGAGDADRKELPNLLRLFVGDMASEGERDLVWQLETNLDDVPGELVGALYDRLFVAGALDVWTTPVQMKKSRPGLVLGLLAPPDRLAAVEEVLFRETSTLGVRRFPVERTKLRREQRRVATSLGEVTVKVAYQDGRVTKVSPEFDEIDAIARRSGLSLPEVIARIDAEVRRTECEPASWRCQSR